MTLMKPMCLVRQMIGADMREMSAEFQQVWLNEEIIRVNQDPLGKQGVRVRGNASECQVWLRHLDNGNELYVVLFNNGKGSCAPSAPGHAPSRFAGPSQVPPASNATMQLTWEEIGVPPECMLSTTELITGVYWGTIQGGLNVSLRPQASAAFRMHPHCDVPTPPPPLLF